MIPLYFMAVFASWSTGAAERGEIGWSILYGFIGASLALMYHVMNKK